MAKNITVTIDNLSYISRLGDGAPSTTPTKNGDLYVDTTNDIPYIAVGVASSADWRNLVPIVTRYVGTDVSGQDLTHTSKVWDSVLVIQNNTVLRPTDDYTVSGSVITFDAGITINDADTIHIYN